MISAYDQHKHCSMILDLIDHDDVITIGKADLQPLEDYMLDNGKDPDDYRMEKIDTDLYEIWRA